MASVAADTIAPGLVHVRYMGTETTVAAHVVTVDLRRQELSVESALAGGTITGRERTSSIARRHSRLNDSVLVAINADFFDLETGEVENNQVAGGEVVRATSLTDSPHDVFDNVHSQIAVTADGRPLLERFRFRGNALLPDGMAVRIDRMNSEDDSAAVVLYTGVHDSPTPSIADGAHFDLSFLFARGDTAVYVVAEATGGGGVAIPAGGAVLAASGDAAAALRRALSQGDTLRTPLGFEPDHGPIRTLVGGWPRIVRHGVNVAMDADSVEGTFPRFSRERHPRTAVGFSRDSTILYLVAVDGRQDSSAGMTLDEVAGFMLEIGAYHALNLDGGGSTMLVVRDEVVNSPSDAQGERTVGNALLVHRRGHEQQ